MSLPQIWYVAVVSRAEMASHCPSWPYLPRESLSLRTPRDTWLHTHHRHHHRLRLDGLDAGGRSRPPPLPEQSRQVTARWSRSGVSGGSTPWMTMGVSVVGRMDRIARKAFVPERSGVVIGANVAGDRHVSLGRTRCPC